MAAWGALAASLQAPARACTLRIANQLFGAQAYAFEPAYLEQVRAAYGAPLEAIAFDRDPDAARDVINAWVSDHTERRILDLLPPGSIGSDTRLVLVNAIYFLGAWHHAFPRAATFDEKFTTARGPRPVAMMHRTASFGLATDDGVGILELPYAGGDMAMWIVLPDDVDGLARVEQALDAATLAAWGAALDVVEVAVSLPRFTIDPPSPMALAEDLGALGMRRAFDADGADFTGIANPPDPADRLFISAVFHKAFVQVDEQGTEAAAATAVAMSRAGGMPEPVVEFRVDRPFLFLIVDKISGLVLFLGRVVDPS
jgi:serpin B